MDDQRARSSKSGKTTAFFCYLLGSIFIALGLLALMLSRQLGPLTVVPIILGVAYIFGGVRYSRLSPAKRAPTA